MKKSLDHDVDALLPEQSVSSGEEVTEDVPDDQMEGVTRKKDGTVRVKEGAREKTAKKAAAEQNHKEPWLKSLGMVDYIGLGASAAILIGLFGMLLTWMNADDWGANLDLPDPKLDLPATGKIFKVTDVETYWRLRRDTDRAQDTQKILPEIKLKVEALQGTGVLSVFFRDPSGKMSADPGNIHLSGGQLSVNENEGSRDSDGMFTFTSTKGFAFEPAFRSYIDMEEHDFWSIEIVESPKIGDRENTKRVAFFRIEQEARLKDKEE